jgi:hypothetical protein
MNQSRMKKPKSVMLLMGHYSEDVDFVMKEIRFLSFNVFFVSGYVYVLQIATTMVAMLNGDAILVGLLRIHV